MGIYKRTDVTMILDGLDLIAHGKVAGAPLNQEGQAIELDVLGDANSDTRPGAANVSIPLDIYADDGTYSALTRIKGQVDSESVPLSYGVQGTGAGSRVWHLPSVGINGYGITPTLNGYTRANATLANDGDVYYSDALVARDWADSDGTGQSSAPASTVDGIDTEADTEHAVNGVDIVRQGGKDYLVFATAAGARVPVTMDDDKWELYVASGSATWTDRTVTVAASDTGRAEITAGLSAAQRTAFNAAQTAGATMGAKPVETHDGATVIWYVESATWGARERLRLRLWERAGTSGTWGTVKANGILLSAPTLPTAISVRANDDHVLRYVACSHNFDQGSSTDDDDLTVRYRCEFIRHLNCTRI